MVSSLCFQQLTSGQIFVAFRSRSSSKSAERRRLGNGRTSEESMMGRTLCTTLCLLVGLLALISCHVYTIFHRAMPAGLAEVEKIRWLDALGRLARKGSDVLDSVGINAGIQPLKIFINTAFSILFNPLPWQRVVYRNIRVNQDVYSGVTVSTYTPVQKTFPAHCQGYPTIVYFHGGGWTWLSVGVYDGPLKNFANRSQFKIIAVEYRKAPQNPFPAAYEDCVTVTKYVIEHARQLNVCKELIVLAGDGAGGNLAAAVALDLHRSIRLQILINPALQMLNFATPSYQDFSENSLLPGITSSDKEINNWMRYGNIHIHFKQSLARNRHVDLDLYNAMSHMIDSRIRLPVPFNFTENETIYNTSQNTNQNTIHNTRQKTIHNTSQNTNQNTIHNASLSPLMDSLSPLMDSLSLLTDSLIRDPRFNPMFVPDIRNVADAYIITSQYDVLRDEALMYGHRLQENGVKVELHHYRHGFHGFFLFAGGGWIEFEESQKAMDHLVKYLNREMLGLRTKA